MSEITWGEREEKLKVRARQRDQQMRILLSARLTIIQFISSRKTFVSIILFLLKFPLFLLVLYFMKKTKRKRIDVIEINPHNNKIISINKFIHSRSIVRFIFSDSICNYRRASNKILQTDTHVKVGTRAAQSAPYSAINLCDCLTFLAFFFLTLRYLRQDVHS